MKRSNLGTMVPVTKAMRQEFRSEIKRTGVTALMLLKDVPDLPDGLTVAHVNRWGSGIVDTAPARHVAYVMDRWASLPDAGSVKRGGELLPKRGARHADGAKRIALTEEMSQSLRAELARTGIDHAAFLTDTRNLPSGLTARIIRGWLYQDAATTDAHYWDFVMAQLRATPDLAGPLPTPIKRPRRKMATIPR